VKASNGALSTLLCKRPGVGGAPAGDSDEDEEEEEEKEEAPYTAATHQVVYLHAVYADHNDTIMNHVQNGEMIRFGEVPCIISRVSACATGFAQPCLWVPPAAATQPHSLSHAAVVQARASAAT
jgi:hypothetical protein